MFNAQVDRVYCRPWGLFGGHPGAGNEVSVLVGEKELRFPSGKVLGRQLQAILASGSRVPILKRINAPTLIIHGQQDPLVPVAAAHDLGKHIPGARVEIIPGMGHDLPPELLPQIGGLLVKHAQNTPAH